MQATDRSLGLRERKKIKTRETTGAMMAASGGAPVSAEVVYRIMEFVDAGMPLT